MTEQETARAVTARPTRRVPWSPLDHVVEIMAFAGIVVCVLCVGGSWKELPESIPHHFGLSGKPDAWGGKWVLIFLPAVAVVMYAALSVLALFPHRFSYWWAITEHNAARQYRVAVSMVRWLKAEVVWLFAFITWTTVQTAMGKSEGLGAEFLPIVLVVIFGTIAVHLVLAYRSR